jgi:hypothetical protein
VQRPIDVSAGMLIFPKGTDNGLGIPRSGAFSVHNTAHWKPIRVAAVAATMAAAQVATCGAGDVVEVMLMGKDPVFVFTVLGRPWGAEAGPLAGQPACRLERCYTEGKREMDVRPPILWRRYLAPAKQ